MPAQRYVPLLCWILVLVTGLCIALKIVSYGFLPAGDARRHVAKALTDKELPQIVVLTPEYKIDQSPGWDWILRRLHRSVGLGEDALISFSVAALLLCILLTPLPWLRRPEAWLAAILALLVALPDLMMRLTQGRPYLLSETVLIGILLAWSNEGPRRPSWQKIVMTTMGFALSTWAHGTWYLWVLVLAAFFLAGAWRQLMWLGGCWMVGTVAGALLSGQPVAFLYEAVFMAASIYKEHAPSWILVGEFQPSDGEFYTLVILALVFLWRRSQGKNMASLMRQPVFWMIAMGWILGFKADRFWADWGLPAAAVWLALQFDEAMTTLWPADSMRRLLVCALIAAPLFLDATSDLRARYSASARDESIVDSRQEALQGWMPDDGGIFYSAEMAFFYNTFYQNPQGNWRYILGFEPALMPADDLKILRKIQLNHNDWGAYRDWVGKLRPQDRLEIASPVQPAIAELEWRAVARGIWIGRLPRTK